MAVVSPTPIFMRFALEAWRKGYRIGWAMHKAGEKLGHKEDALHFVGNRPKTPIVDAFGKEPYQKTGRWLARFFRPVSDALIDGLSDEEVLKIWIATDRKEDKGSLSFKRANALREVVVVGSRQLSPKNGSFFRRK